MHVVVDSTLSTRGKTPEQILANSIYQCMNKIIYYMKEGIAGM
jgi:hypothetical protein